MVSNIGLTLYDYGCLSAKRSNKLFVDIALDLAWSFFDHADIYGGG